MVNRLLPDGHGCQVRATFDLVAPLAHKATDMRTTESAGSSLVRSGAVSQLIGESPRPGDVDSANKRSTPRTATTPGCRTSTTATRITTTSRRRAARVSSANQNVSGHADFSFEALVSAYLDCRRNKRNTASALAWEQVQEWNLVRLHESLLDRTYRPGPSICFVNMRPRPREVWAAAFGDRVAHHYLYNHVAPRFEAGFIADSCACIAGRGTLYAARRLEAHVRSATQNWKHKAFYLKLDVANFFVSIDKRRLFSLLTKRINEPQWLWLTQTILFHDPRPNVVMHSSPEKMALIPPHKRLCDQPAHLGLPIGNLSSQFFANVYLNLLDQHVKHTLRAKHYCRYVDDCVLLHESPDWLRAAHDDIAEFLPRELGIQINPRKTIIQPIDRGIDFVGQVIRPWSRTTRRRTFNDAIHRIATMPVDDLYTSGNSYFGLFRQASNSHADRAQLANVLRSKGRAVNKQLTKTYKKYNDGVMPGRTKGCLSAEVPGAEAVLNEIRSTCTAGRGL